MNRLKFLMFLAITGLLALSVNPAIAQTGNGAPSGAHYNLNIVGVSNPKTADMTQSNGHTIFVSLFGKSKINLAAGPYYQVTDANGTDGNGAAFQLPNPDPDNDGTTAYSVYARALGKPGGSATMTTCASDIYGEVYCSLYSTVQVRSKGKSMFENVSKELLYIYYDLNGDGTAERYPLFDSALQGYFWDYDSLGLKHLQLRFYEVPTTV